MDLNAPVSANVMLNTKQHFRSNVTKTCYYLLQGDTSLDISPTCQRLWLSNTVAECLRTVLSNLKKKPTYYKWRKPHRIACHIHSIAACWPQSGLRILLPHSARRCRPLCSSPSRDKNVPHHDLRLKNTVYALPVSFSQNHENHFLDWRRNSV